MHENILKFVISVIICESAGVFGSLFTFSSVSNWFPTLVKPWFSPPSWIFGPVWVILYFLMVDVKHMRYPFVLSYFVSGIS
jgi:tryptophan-rich sensory protein